MRLYPHEKPEVGRQKPRRYGPWRGFGLRAVESCCRWLGGRALYRRLYLGPGRVQVRHESLALAPAQRGLAGLRLVQLSDLHAGPFLGRGDLADVVALVQELAPDLIVYTGDFIAHQWTDALLVLEDLARLSAPLGSFAVFGNHDYRGRCEAEIARAYAARGICFLRNESRRLPFGSTHFHLVGVEDVEEARVVDVARARARVCSGEAEFVLCHNPMSAPIFAHLGARLILSGHTHGTQVDLPILRRMGPQHPGLRVEFGGSTLIVNRGLGVIGVPWRCRAPAEVVHIRCEVQDDA